jgi:hypothetical protein
MISKGKIELLDSLQGQKTFKSGRYASEEHLTKSNPVRQRIDASIPGKKGGLPAMKVSQPEGRHGSAPKVRTDSGAKVPGYKPKFAQPVTKKPTSHERPVRGEFKH